MKIRISGLKKIGLSPGTCQNKDGLVVGRDLLFFMLLKTNEIFRGSI